MKDNERMTGDRWEAVCLQLGGLRAPLLAFGRAVAPQADAHRREEVQLPGVSPPFYALWPPDQTRPTPRSPAEATGLASGCCWSQISSGGGGGGSSSNNNNNSNASSTISPTAAHCFLHLIPISLINQLNIVNQRFKCSELNELSMVIFNFFSSMHLSSQYCHSKFQFIWISSINLIN